MKKIFSLFLTAAIVLSAWAFSFAAPSDLADADILISPAPESKDITIVFTNDVHCSYLAYDKVAALAKNADLLVDAGDALLGDLIGSLSKGEYVIDIMNYLGYDAAVPGNHEFTCGISELLDFAKTKADFGYACCNFTDLRTGKLPFDAYQMFEVKGKKIAIVGITTPETFTQALPAIFQDKNGNYIYGFCEGNNGKDLSGAVQKAVDEARAAGADYVIAVGHLGINEKSKPWRAQDIIAGTNGIDAFIDGHSHSVYTDSYKNKDGKSIPAAQTGTGLINCGKLTITEAGEIKIENIAVDDIEADPEATAFIESITARFDDLQKKVVAKTEVDLTIKNEDGTRAVRTKETNMANFCTDAFRAALGADLAFANGGGVRADIPKGDISFGDIVSVTPYGNKLCLVEVNGQQILDALELGYSKLPDENGGFIQVSGLTCTINTAIPSPVITNDKGEFVEVRGQRRVSDVKINGEALDVSKKYKLTAIDYMLLDSGDGFTMFGRKNVNILQESVILDYQALINYIVDDIGGVIGQEYAKARTNLNIIHDETLAETGKVPAGTYKVVSGDCLWSIAKRLYGDGSKWELIYKANKSAIKNKDLIYVNQILEIPAA